MFEESAGFDPTSLQEGFVQSENGINFSQPQSFSMEEQSFPQNPISAMEMELQQQINSEVNYNNNHEMQGVLDHNHHHHQNHLIQEIMHENSNWGFNGDHQTQNNNFTPETPYPTTPDLLNMFPLPRSSLLPSPSFTFSNPTQKPSPGFLASLGLLGDLNPTAENSLASGSSVNVYDPLLPLNLPPQPPLLRELFHSLPNHGAGYGIKNGSLFGNGGVDEMRDMSGGLYQDGDGRQFENGVFEYSAGEIDCLGKNRDGKDTKHFATERHRRVLLNDKYQALRKLIPQPTKNDRASIVGDAIEYINELKREANMFKVLLEKKRCARERRKRPKTEEEAIEGNDSKSDMDHPFNGSSVGSSWLHRKSKTTEVDVRIVDDEVTVKLVQQKRVNCLLFVSRVLDELQLDLHHVAGGLIGDYYSFLFNSKICEGSIVYASAIANKLIEVVDKQYAAIQPSNGY